MYRLRPVRLCRPSLLVLALVACGTTPATDSGIISLAPTVNVVFPASGPIGGGNPITIFGTQFGLPVQSGAAPGSVLYGCPIGQLCAFLGNSVLTGLQVGTTDGGVDSFDLGDFDAGVVGGFTALRGTASPAIVAGAVDVFVVNPDGTSGVLLSGYVYRRDEVIPPPRVDGGIENDAGRADAGDAGDGGDSGIVNDGGDAGDSGAADAGDSGIINDAGDAGIADSGSDAGDSGFSDGGGGE